MGIGANVQKIAQKENISLKELSRRSQIPYTTIYNMVKRDSDRVSPENVQKLADALDVTPGYLLYGDRNPVQRSLFDAEDTAKALKGELQKSLETGKITPALTNGKAAKALSVLENQMWTAVDEIGKESGSALLQLFRFLPPDLRDIVVYYEELNADGQRVARERIEELTQIYKYQREEKHPPENAQDAQDAAGDAPKDTDHKNS